MGNEEKGLILQRFVANCRKLQIEEEISQNAMKTFFTLNVDGALSNEADEWLFCAVYSKLQATKLADMRQGAENPKANVLEAWEKKARCNSWNISLTKLLRSFGLNINRFLKKMEHWNWIAQTSEIFQQEINELDHRLGITLLLMKHYNRFFKQLYVWPKSTESQTHYNMMYEFGWLLFLIVRNELPAFATSNLINGCQVLICSLELVYVNALEVHKSDIIRPDFSGVPPKWCSSDFDISRLQRYSAMDAICELIPELPAKGTHIMKNIFFHKAVMGLFMDQRLLGNDRFMRELIKDGILEVNFASLNRSYATHVCDISEIDERVLLKHSPESTPALKENGGVTGDEPNCRSLDGTRQDNITKLLLHNLPQMLPASIAQAVGQEINMLENSLRKMSAKFENAARLNQEAAELRFSLVRGLYYGLLNKIIDAELQRKPTLKISKMLLQLQLTFNATLIACCLELVLYMYTAPKSQLQFPWLLECCSIEAYEFQKIIELVVRHEKGLLTRDLVKHLQEVEAQCLDSLIWHKNSKLWAIIDRTGLPSCQELQNPETKASSSTAICLRKFYRLANERLTYLCKCLSLLNNYFQIWHTVEYSIVVQGASLLQQRHLDQLLMCAVYLTARSLHLRISFSDIIQQYRRQPHVQSATYRAVRLAEGQAKSDIITFYNQVYVRRMSEYAKELLCVQSPSVSSDHVFAGRPLQELSNGNIFVSPVASPGICVSDSCKANIIIKKPQIMKRAHSDNELAKATSSKRPNILRRRTTYQ